MNLRAVAHALGGVVAGDHVLAPGPDHLAPDRSLSRGIGIREASHGLEPIHG